MGAFRMGDGKAAEASGAGLGPLGCDITKVIVEKQQPRRFFVEGCGGSRVPARV